MTAADWRPCADRDTLAARASFLADIRAFFAARGVLEADVPALSAAGAVEPHLRSVACDTAEGRRYLHTSPEFGLKRLLAAGSGPVYQLAHVFRDGERGRWHNPEFTMLEWYRPARDEHGLVEELVALLDSLGIPGPVSRMSFSEAFSERAGLDPFSADSGDMAEVAADLGAPPAEAPSDPRDARPFWLDALMGLHVVPRLGADGPCLVHDFPADMAGLTRVRAGEPPVAARFELFWRGIELANGGMELADAAALRARFDADAAARRRQGLPAPPTDARLAAALDHGLPDCAGVAVGVDRLLALKLGFDALAPVLPFTDDRA